MAQSMRSNLIITRAGPSSLHEQWVDAAAPRNYDVLVAAYCPAGLDKAKGDYNFLIPGLKVEGWDLILETHKNIVDRYENVALIDDDISCSPAELSRCFDLGAENGLSIWQPSLSWDSFYTFAGTLNNPKFSFREVNFIEMMCPFFSRKALAEVRSLFRAGWESGIDLVWCSVLPEHERRFAIVDEVQVRHTRPIGAQKVENGLGAGEQRDIYDCLAHFHMSWPSLVASGGVTRDKKRVGALGVSLRLPGLFGSIFVTPNDRAIRRVCDHIRHQIMRPSRFGDEVQAIVRRDHIFAVPAAEPS